MSTIRTRGRFTNTAVPRFDGDGCWQQHLHIFNAIAKSNGWTDETFAHLNGEALSVALLMPEGERANREGLSQGLSDYYYSPGRLAVFQRQFESATRRTGMDPATFATELEILAVRGFGDMGTGARNRMVRDKFIADQRTVFLRIRPSGTKWIVAVCVRVIRSRRGGQPQELAWTGDFRGCPVTPGSLGSAGQIHSRQLGVRRWIHGFRCPWLMWSRVTTERLPPLRGACFSGWEGPTDGQLPVGHEHGPGWSSSMQAFPPLGSHPSEIHGRDNQGMLDAGPGSVSAGMEGSGCAGVIGSDVPWLECPACNALTWVITVTE